MRRSSGRARVAVPVRAKKPSLCEELSDKCEAQRRIIDWICAWPISHYSLTKLCSCGPEWAAINIKKSTCSIRILNWNINSRLGELEWMWQNQFPGIARRHEEGRLAFCQFILVQRGPSILILKFDLMNLPFDWWITTSNRQPLHTSKSLHQVHISSRLYRTKRENFKR